MEDYVAVKDLKISFKSYDGQKRIVDIDELKIAKGEAFGLVGESGAGKSVLALALLKLLTVPPAVIESGSIRIGDLDILSKSEREMENIRGKKIAMIFQDPMSTLNPVFTVGQQIIKVIAKNQNLKGKQARKKALEMIELVKLPDAEQIMEKYPHELSGGQRQRVIIAIALACGAEFLIADEPTRNLDVTIQAGILKLLAELQKTLKVTVLFIANNLSLVSLTCRRIGLLYHGQIVEQGEVGEILEHPAHPYTKTLLQPLPQTQEEKEAVRRSLAVQDQADTGCPYQFRCPKAAEICRKEKPPVCRIGENHEVHCHLWEEGGSADERATAES